MRYEQILNAFFTFAPAFLTAPGLTYVVPKDICANKTLQPDPQFMISLSPEVACR